MIALLAELATVVGEMHVMVKEARPCGDDEVVPLMEMELHGTASGMDLSGQLAQVEKIVEGRIRRTRAFMSWAEALEAVGLAELPFPP